jgi:hypothetical protein
LILGLEYQHLDLGSKNAFCGNPSCTAGNSFDLDATADIVRARLTIKTKGYGWFRATRGNLDLYWSVPAVPK